MKTTEQKNAEAVIAMQKRIKDLLERIEFAVDYLPASPDKAKSYLTPALKGK